MTTTLPALTDEEIVRLDADFRDMLGNGRVSLRAAVTAIPYKARKCRACQNELPAGRPCAEFRWGTARKKWSWHFCIPCAPAEVRPLDERRALRWLAQTLAGARTLAEVPDVAWRVLGDLRSAGVPF